MNTNGARVKRTFIRAPPPINATPPSTSSPPSAFGSTDNGGAASLFTAEPNLSQIRLNNVLPRPAFTTRGAWLSSENTSPLPLHKRKEAALPERKPACCASPCLGILSTMCACTVLAPRPTMFGFYRRALWVQGCGLCVNSTAARLLCGEGEVFRLDSNRGHFMC